MPIEPLTHDCKGRPFQVGDVVKLFHFIHYRRRQKMYMYKVVTEHKGMLYLTCIRELIVKPDDPHKCILHKGSIDQEDIEIVEGYNPCLDERKIQKPIKKEVINVEETVD